ncbi:hypothetical protein PPERSA_12319 [Pseudocohnilembus persalinus]|uniref:EF-hand domain-containing protein n=1 Tax=Pseudocohnilembus persalinus TaxID=266149 RepID=A0A0V0R925_PSEPJ|nr:hypothetical protein PPERSA_12319 [Pseudocohnilembus persalinus]|eukprot:KRX10991.1 hypothetical protein PPERSA_12319 [Pseudocohnilembus persalinus]
MVVDTWTSQAVPHLSTNHALRRLTSEFQWDPMVNLFDANIETKKDGQGTDDIEEVDKSTIMSLLMYMDLHKTQTEFFAYIKRTLENSNSKDQKETLTKEQFVNLFLEPNVKFDNLKNDEMASIFRIFDTKEKGSFSAEDFLHYYKLSPEFMSLSKQEQEELETKIIQDFEVVANNKEITPIEFFKIINMPNQ